MQTANNKHILAPLNSNFRNWEKITNKINYQGFPGDFYSKERLHLFQYQPYVKDKDGQKIALGGQHKIKIQLFLTQKISFYGYSHTCISVATPTRKHS